MGAYAESWRTWFESTLEFIQKPDSHLFAPGCYHHCSTETNVMYEVKVNGRTLAEYLNDWMTGKLGPKDLIMKDSCKGFNCGDGCPKATASFLQTAKSRTMISLFRQ